MKKATLFSRIFFKKLQCRPRMLVSGTQGLDPRLKLAGMTMMLGASLLLCFSTPSLFAQMPVPAAGAVLPAGLERIGVVAAAGGKVELTTPGQVGRIAQSGQPVFLGDLVSTDAKGHLQILLLDETVFTIGPSSAITIDKFVYDPKTSAGEIKASVAKGVFRYVSGKIAVKNPSKVTVKLPTATLGFRGTIVGGSVGADGQGLVGLLGPGDNNDAGAQTGSFTIEGQGGDQQGVDRTGFGVEIGADGGLSDVFQMSQDQVNGLTGGLGGGAGGGQGGGQGGDGEGEGGLDGGNMGDLSGETGALTGDMAGFTEGLSGVTDGLNDLSTFVAQNETNTGSASTDNTTTVAQLESITSGSYFYSVSGVFTQTIQDGSAVSHEGTFTASWYANFVDRKIDTIEVEINTTSGGGNITVGGGEIPVTLTEQLFSAGSDGKAIFNTSGDSGTVTATITLKNSGSDIAHTGEITVGYDANVGYGQNLGSGSGSATAIISEP